MWDHPNTDVMISISLKGTTRRPVIVLGPWALKFARDERGRRCNLYEAKLFRNSSEWHREMLCPVRWISPTGWLLIMAAAKPLAEMMPVEDYLEMSEIWDARPSEDRCPFEPKASDWGRINGRLVALDYSITVYLSEEERAEQIRAALAD
jgi:hypothetical protein